MLVVWLTSLLTTAAPCAQLTLRATVDETLSEVHGTVHCVLATAGPLDVALYSRVIDSPEGLNDVNRAWLYPEGFSSSRMRVWRLQRATKSVDMSNGAQTGGPWQRLGVFAAGEAVALGFQAQIPRRNGLFGRRQGVAYLLGGWHPAFGRDGRLDPVEARYEISLPVDAVGFVGQRPFGRTGSRLQRGRFVGRFLPVLVAKSMEVERVSGAVVIRPSGRSAQKARRARAGPSAPLFLRDLATAHDAEAQRQLRDTLRTGESLLRLVSGARDSQPVMVVWAPLREHLVEGFDGGFSISDRAFQLFGWERFLKLHRMSVWRAQFAAAVEPACRARETTLPPILVADAVGAALRDRLALQIYGGKEYAPDLLETFAVIPEIDALIFAPQIPFVDSYYEAIDETPARRWHLHNFDHLGPRGKLLHEKLIDLVGTPAALSIPVAYLRGRKPWLDVLAEMTSVDTRAPLNAWLRPYPRVDYRLMRTTALGETGTPTKSWGTSVRIELQGPDAAAVREPVVVELRDAHGRLFRQARMGPGELDFPTAQYPPRHVQIDPDGRLVELYDSESNRTTRWNNRSPPRWRFLLNNISGLVAVTNRQIELTADFSLRRIYDLADRFDVLVAYDPQAVTGLLAYSRAFGEKITPLSMSQRLGCSLLYSLLLPELPGDQKIREATAALSYRYDNRLSPYWGLQGRGLSIGASASAGHDEANNRYVYGHIGAAALQIWTLSSTQALVGRLRADLKLGAFPAQRGVRLGGLYRGGRGFESDEVRGRSRALASVEHRHVLVAAERTSFFGLWTWTRLEGALFADAIYLPTDRSDCGRAAFYDVGYGLRFGGDTLGVAPGLVSLDFGIPLGRCQGEIDRSPLTVYLSFAQSFADF